MSDIFIERDLEMAHIGKTPCENQGRCFLFPLLETLSSGIQNDVWLYVKSNLTYSHRLSYNRLSSNKARLLETPGDRIVYL